jgi:hypothetical protein
MKRKPSLLGLAFTALFASSLTVSQAQEAVRTWVDQTGRAVRATLVGVRGAEVVLQLENNTTVTVPLARFSAPDKTYVTQRAKTTEATATAATAAPPALTGWPEMVSVDPKTVQIVNGEQNAAERRFVYSSGAFQFTATAPLTGVLMKEVASDFELVRALFAKLPWDWQPKPEGGGPLFLANLYETDQEFVDSGGSENSSGRSQDGIIFTKFSALGLKKVGAKYAQDARRDSQGEMIILITRLVMGDMRDLCLPWSGNGFEKFLEDVAYRNGSFHLGKPQRAIKELVESSARSGVAPDADAMVKLLHSTWVDTRPGNTDLDFRRRTYFHAAMLYFFFGYLDGKGDGARLHRYFQALAKDATALRNYREARKAGNNSIPNPQRGSLQEASLELNKHVIDGRSDEALRAEIVEKFKAMGIKI